MIPIIGEVLSLVDSAVDKIFPDADTKEKIKADLKNHMMNQAMEEKKLLFQDTDSARDAYKEELKMKGVPGWARAIQALGRPFALYSTVSMYIYTKVSTQIGAMIGKDLPLIEMTDMDYYLVGTVFVFLFGARSLEKLRGKQ